MKFNRKKLNLFEYFKKEQRSSWMGRILLGSIIFLITIYIYLDVKEQAPSQHVVMISLDSVYEADFQRLTAMPVVQ